MTEARRIHLATGNPHKVREFSDLARALVNWPGPRPEFVPAPVMPAVIEDAGTFVGNALKKALALKANLGSEDWVLADDSGLCVDALHGAPGVESAYYAGKAGDAAANLNKLVDDMRDVLPENRQAHFVCVLALLPGVGAPVLFEGRCDGYLLVHPQGGAGFGYDPLFIPLGYLGSYAELGDEVKARISHRALAWSKLADWLRTDAGR